METRSLSVIAREISTSWNNPYFGAIPYIQAMRTLTSINDHYGFDDAKSIVNYFLANAQTWRGDDARRIKAELNGMLKPAQNIEDYANKCRRMKTGRVIGKYSR
jgi:hypothetical protein